MQRTPQTAPFRRRRHAHDRAIETGRDDRRSAIADRRAQRRGRKRQSGGENDGRGWLPLAGVSTPCGSRPLHPSDTLVDAGRRVFPSAHRRGQSGEPPSDSRERPRERNGDPPIDGREPPACRESSDDGNRSSDFGRRIARRLWWARGEFGCSKFLARIVCRSARISRSMAGSRRSVSLARFFSGIVIAVPIAWFNLSSHLANALQSESRTGTISRAAQRLRHGFIVAQIALAFVLLAGAALLGLSLKKVMAVSPGFRADHVLTGEFTIPFGNYPDGSPNASPSSIACWNQSASNRESPPPERSRTFR